MKSRKGFTLIELMVVVLIVAVLAAVLVPLLTARLAAARWTEGKAGAGTIATAVRAMAAEYGDEMGDLPTAIDDYVTDKDLKGKYFEYDDYSFVSGQEPSLTPEGDYPVTYTIRVDRPDETRFPTVPYYTLDHTGLWTKGS